MAMHTTYPPSTPSAPQPFDAFTTPHLPPTPTPAPTPAPTMPYALPPAALRFPDHDAHAPAPLPLDALQRPQPFQPASPPAPFPPRASHAEAVAHIHLRAQAHARARAQAHAHAHAQHARAEAQVRQQAREQARAQAHAHALAQAHTATRGLSHQAHALPSQMHADMDAHMQAQMQQVSAAVAAASQPQGPSHSDLLGAFSGTLPSSFASTYDSAFQIAPSPPVASAAPPAPVAASTFGNTPGQSFDSHTLELALLCDEVPPRAPAASSNQMSTDSLFKNVDLDPSAMLPSHLHAQLAEKERAADAQQRPSLLDAHALTYGVNMPNPPCCSSVQSPDLTTESSRVNSEREPRRAPESVDEEGAVAAASEQSALSIVDIERCDFSKPINALGPLCFGGFYLVSLTRTIVKNATVPLAVRHVFMAPQLHFGFTVRDKKDARWRNIATSQISYSSLSAAGDWLRRKLCVMDEAFTFKNIKDALQKAVTDAVADGRWDLLVCKLQGDFPDVSEHEINEALRCETISGRAKSTTHEFFKQLNCHKGAPDIRRDVDGAISAREALKTVLAQLGLNSSGNNISIARFRDDIHPLWRLKCQYVRDHEHAGCCQFSDGGYFKKIMVHKHLYSASGATSPYHVKDLFEGLEEVIKLWNNPTGMCVREAKCAAGLKYNVDKSFQSGIRSYSKVKFLETAPHTAQRFLDLERELFNRARRLLELKQKKYPKCRRALCLVDVNNSSLTQRQLPEFLEARFFDMTSRPTTPVSRKRTRQERDAMSYTSTPREQKRQHAHRTLERKKATEDRVKQYLEQLREDCQKQQNFLDTVKSHGTHCTCHAIIHSDVVAERLYPTSDNTTAA